MMMQLAILKKAIQKTACARLLLPATMLLPTSWALADDHPHDHGDNPVLTTVIIDQFEMRDAGGANPMALEAQAWIGKDLNKLWLKTDVERRDGKTEDAEVQALYSRAIAPFWDIQMGVRYDGKPTPTRTWAVIGVQGLAPYWFDIDTALFIGESGRTAARFSIEYDRLFTQRLILSHYFESNFYGQNDAETGTGSGLADLEAGLRLRYEIRREFAPYIGVNWNKKFGNTADFAGAKGEAVQDTQLVVGLRAWF